MYRAERLDGKGKVEGWYGCDGKSHGIINFGVYANVKLIKYETLEIYLFGEWRLVSELETKYKLVEVSEYDILIKKAFMFDNGLGEEDMKDDSKPEHL